MTVRTVEYGEIITSATQVKPWGHEVVFATGMTSSESILFMTTHSLPIAQLLASKEPVSSSQGIYFEWMLLPRLDLVPHWKSQWRIHLNLVGSR